METASGGNKMGEVMYIPSKDPMFQKPYIDLQDDRVRKVRDGSEIPFHYVHGGFGGTNVKFSLCFPKKEQYRECFIQYLSPFPGPDEEMASVRQEGGVGDKIAFSLTYGAYFVESNMGSKARFGGKTKEEATLVWKASAAVAQFSRKVAAQWYQYDHRPYGFVYGGSGGGYKTLACIENTRVWDGAAPYVIGSSASLPNTITLHAQGQRALRHCFGKIVDALDAGGSGNMYAGLTAYEQSMLNEITNMGFPPQTWFREADGTIDDGSLPVLMPLIQREDPEYFKDFWEKEGYEGADPDGDAQRDRFVFESRVVSVHFPTEDNTDDKKTYNSVDNAWKKILTDGGGSYIEIETAPKAVEQYMGGTRILFESGECRGKELALSRLIESEDGEHSYLLINYAYGMGNITQVLEEIHPGDLIRLDNSDYVAALFYYRHQVPEDLHFHAWDQFRDETGRAIPPQRKFLGKEMTGTGTVQDGNIQCKVIVTQALMDESTCPWCGDWYRDLVRDRRGTEDDFRIYYYQRCLHGNDWNSDNNMVIEYEGGLRQTLIDLMDWVQYGKLPLPTTEYERDGGNIFITKRGAERNGLQAQVVLLANGEKCAHVKAGEEVQLTTKVEIPKGAGEVTSVYYDFQDNWKLPDPEAFPICGSFQRTLDDGVHGAVSKITHRYDQLGTYFASVRITTNRNGDAAEIYTQVKNLDRVRIVVE